MDKSIVINNFNDMSRIYLFVKYNSLLGMIVEWFLVPFSTSFVIQHILYKLVAIQDKVKVTE